MRYRRRAAGGADQSAAIATREAVREVYPRLPSAAVLGAMVSRNSKQLKNLVISKLRSWR
jgi:hypothetical protein